jgi:hypothetical protein
MPADLQYYTLYTADASATNTLTVLGETGVASTVDQTIVVHVPASALKEALTFNPSWEIPADNVLDTEKLPTVTWDPSKLEAAMKLDGDSKTAEDRFLAKYTLQGKDATFEDDAGSSLETMQQWIAYVPPPADSDIEKIPFEAIIKVVPGAVTAGKLGDSQRLGASPVVVGNADAGAHASDVMNLFEQALAAGRATESANGDVGAAGAGKLEFVNGDSITVYVVYTISKTVRVEIDVVNATGSAQYQIPGVAQVIDTAHPLEESTADADKVSKTVAYKFLAHA